MDTVVAVDTTDTMQWIQQTLDALDTMLDTVDIHYKVDSSSISSSGYNGYVRHTGFTET
jgi:hypothetical protein